MAKHHIGKERILSVDSMRGVAMALVILQHSYHLIDPSTVSAFADTTIYGLTRMASVGFMSISGMMIGYFLYTSDDWHAVYRRFAKRAVFLLLLARPAMALTRWPFTLDLRFERLVHNIFYDFPITDTIALSLLIAPLILRYFSRAAIIVLTAVLLVSTTVVLAVYHPTQGPLDFGRAFFFGQLMSESALGIGWPLFPWLAIFLIGSLLGHELADVKKGKLTTEQLARRMRTAALYLAGIGIILSVAYKFLKLHYGGVWDPRIFEAIYPTRTTSLLPVYLAILLGVFSYLMVRIDVKGKYDRFAWSTSVLGRTSLFTYVIQFAVVQSAPALLGLKGHINLWEYFALFVIGLPVTWVISYTYGRLRGWITAKDYALLKGMSRRSPA